MAELFDLDRGIVHCPCGTLTANDWLLCTRCTNDEANDREFHRGSGHADPNGVRA